jgi:hypothetical protein
VKEADPHVASATVQRIATQPVRPTPKALCSHIPVRPQLAHTCFASLELPPYPTIERMREAILAACRYGSVGILNA